jgi:hypothetical protein
VIDHDLSPEELAAIRALKRLAKKWPKSLWLFSASGSLCVMKVGPDGERMYKGEGVDHDYIVDHIHNLPNDGGDF